VRFVMLVPKSLDPEERAHKMPVPDPRPSEKIAKLFPQVAPAKSVSKDQKDVGPAPASAVAQAQTLAAPVPLPEARPASAPSRDPRRYRRSQ